MNTLSLYKTLHLFWKENRKIVFVTSAFFSNNKIETRINEFVDTFYGTKTTTIKKNTNKIHFYRSNIKTNKQLFLISSRDVWMFGLWRIKKIPAGSCWALNTKVILLCSFSSGEDYFFEVIKNTQFVDMYKLEEIYGVWPIYHSYSGSSNKLLKYVLDHGWKYQNIELENIISRGYSRILRTDRPYGHWSKRYDICDIAYPCVVVDHKKEFLICRDGNRRIIKMKRLGMKSCRACIFSAENAIKIVDGE